MLESKTKKEFTKNIFDENSEIIQKYMEKNNITLKSAYDEFLSVIFGLKHESLHLENNKGSLSLLKDANQYLGIKLGYYRLAENPKKTDLEGYWEHWLLELTDKGTEIKKIFETLQ